jgi:putative sigma-54 modulation protein
MRVTVTGRHFEVTPAVRSYVDARLGRLHRYTGQITSAKVTLSTEKRRHRAEITLESKGREFTSKDVSEDMFSALDSVTHKLERQLSRYKDKRTTARKSGRRAAKANGGPQVGTLRVLRGTSVGEGPQEHDVLEAGDYPLEKLTVDEAIMRLEDSDREFLVFTNRATDVVHVVYKLPKGNYGVLNLNTAR